MSHVLQFAFIFNSLKRPVIEKKTKLLVKRDSVLLCGTRVAVFSFLFFVLLFCNNFFQDNIQGNVSFHKTLI